MYSSKIGIIARVSEARMAFQSVTNWPRNTCVPNVTVLVASPEARMSGNQRSFQMGIITNTATVARAGRTNGSTRKKKTRSVLY